MDYELIECDLCDGFGDFELMHGDAASQLSTNGGEDLGPGPKVSTIAYVTLTGLPHLQLFSCQ